MKTCRIIDAHTHPPLDRAQWSAFLAALRFHGIGSIITSCLHTTWAPYPDSAQTREANELAREFCAFSQGMAHWLAYLNPQNEDFREELERSLADGAIGIKLWISLKRPETGSLERVHPLLEEAARRQLPVLIHSGNRTEMQFPGEVGTAEIVTLAKAHPAVKIVEAHAGSNWRAGLGLRAGLANLFVDISGYFPEAEQLDRILEDMGPERVLFGSDTTVRSVASQLARVKFSNASPDVLELVLRENAMRVYGIGANECQVDEIGESRAPREDHFCFFGRWPFHHASHRELGGEIRRAAIGRAFAVNAAGILSGDLLRENLGFFGAVHDEPITPLATLNPRIANWRAQIAHASQAFAGAWISPFFHDYRLDDPAHADFFDLCARERLPLWINCATGDFRWRPHGTIMRPVTAEELISFARTAPANDYIVQAAPFDAVCAILGSGREGIRFEISRLVDFPSHLAQAIKRFGRQPFVYGSEFPLRDIECNRWIAERAMALDDYLSSATSPPAG